MKNQEKNSLENKLEALLFVSGDSVEIADIIEKWQVEVSNGVLDDITLRCKTLDGSLKKDFVFNDVEINRGEKIKCELIIEDATLNDFTTVKDLLGGVVQIYGPKIISLDLEERRKPKGLLTSSPSLVAAD